MDFGSLVPLKSVASGGIPRLSTLPAQLPGPVNVTHRVCCFLVEALFSSSVWWFGTLISIGNFIIPTDELHDFSEG